MRSQLSLLLTLTMLLGASAWADDAGGLDASLPDASVGQGGADRDNPEGQDTTGQTATVCQNDPDCDPGFACDQGRCTYVGNRSAKSSSCLGAMPAALLVGGLAVALGRRRRPAP